MKLRFFASLTLLSLCFSAFALDKQHLQDSLNTYVAGHAKVGAVKVGQVRVRNGQADVYTNATIAALSLNEDMCNEIRDIVRFFTGNKGKVKVYSDKHEISELVTHIHFRGDGRKAEHSKRKHLERPDVQPLTKDVSRPWSAPDGLEGRHIALYGSHGLYFYQKEERWIWQRARLLTTVEDLYTTSYTMPFLVPMLENAGAVVLQPRERDRQTNEVIVDETEAEGIGAWTLHADGGWGPLPDGLLFEGENPFTFGGYAQADKAQARDALVYRPALPEAGEYAVYVSYKTLPNSTGNAVYTVVHQGVETTVEINQTMGGGTWVYLGTFAFSTDRQTNCVRLEAGRTVTADAVRFGGGYGCVARYQSDLALENIPSAKENGSYNARKGKSGNNTPEPFVPPARDKVSDIAFTSGVPKWIEGSRYWLQYAGIPDSVFNYTAGRNDYTDDYASRGRWANWLAGGSSVYPDGPGLNIPLDLFLAFHTDAGTTLGDDIVGTLIIYNEYDDDKQYNYPTGQSRMLARDYADYMQTQIVEDIRATFAPEWSRRRLLNSSYAEARNPKVPAVLLELLSHQNFADMRYGLDPAFRFVVSRAIYKGMLRFCHEQYGTPYVVQPLPVHAFATAFADGNKVRLTWAPTPDSLEMTAMPDGYIVYTRTAGSDWDNGKLVKDTTVLLTVKNDLQYDFRVCAVNKGGRSFPSEVLSVHKASQPKGTVLIVNGFTRVSAPEAFCSSDSLYAGFAPEHYGIGYMNEVNYIGEQYDFRRDREWQSDDQCGFGACNNDMRDISPRGNTFDYPVMHGSVLAEMGYSFTSSSVAAINGGTADDQAPDIVDIILGKQKTTTQGTQLRTTRYEAFPANLRAFLEHYSGRLLLSGSYLGSDMQSKAGKDWTERVLHYSFRAERASKTGQVSLLRNIGRATARLVTAPDEHTLCAEAPDGIVPVGDNAEVVARYADTNIAAAVAYDSGTSHSLIFAFPLESLEDFPTLYRKALLRLTR